MGCWVFLHIENFNFNVVRTAPEFWKKQTICKPLYWSLRNLQFSCGNKIQMCVKHTIQYLKQQLFMKKGCSTIRWAITCSKLENALEAADPHYPYLVDNHRFKCQAGQESGVSPGSVWQSHTAVLTRWADPPGSTEQFSFLGNWMHICASTFDSISNITCVYLWSMKTYKSVWKNFRKKEKEHEFSLFSFCNFQIILFCHESWAIACFCVSLLHTSQSTDHIC